MLNAITASGISPLEYLLSIVRDDGASPDRRFDAAKAAAPYCHARLAQIQATIDSTQLHVVSAEPMSAEEWAEKYSTPAK